MNRLEAVGLSYRMTRPRAFDPKVSLLGVRLGAPSNAIVEDGHRGHVVSLYAPVQLLRLIAGSMKVA